MKRHVVFDHVSGRLSELDKLVVSSVPPGGNWRDLPEDFPSKRIQQIREGAKNGGGSRSTYYGRLRWDRPAYTISTYINRPGNGCFIHPEESRLLTIREAARLQTFPDSIRFSGTVRTRCTQVGNAVPPLLAYQMGMAIPRGKVVDLFAGAGGLGIGLSLAGHEVVLSSDIDKSACSTLSNHMASGMGVFQADLSKDADFEELVARTRAAAPNLDLLVGGPPCQGFSTAGPCRVDDPRNLLVLAFLRFIEKIRPGRVLMENVPALRWRGSVVLDEVRDRLEGLGYQTDVVILHAEAYGVPQLRRRLVLQATLESNLLWPKPTHPLVNPSFPSDQPGSPGGLLTTTVFDAISDLPGDPEDSADTDSVCRRNAKTSLQRWLRGEQSIEHLNSDPRGVARVPERQQSLAS